MTIGHTKAVNGKTVYAPHFFRWRQMMGRCSKPSNPEFCRYGARGIFVCKEWQDFWTFQKWCLETAEKGKTIDRIDNEGPYSPKNCKWATPAEQQKTARRTQAKRDAIKIAQRAMLKAEVWKKRKRNKLGHFA